MDLCIRGARPALHGLRLDFSPQGSLRPDPTHLARRHREVFLR